MDYICEDRVSKSTLFETASNDLGMLSSASGNPLIDVPQAPNPLEDLLQEINDVTGEGTHE